MASSPVTPEPDTQKQDANPFPPNSPGNPDPPQPAAEEENSGDNPEDAA